MDAPRQIPEIVVVGASAGALQALSHLFGALPPDFAPAAAVVVHVPARGPNLIVQVLSTRTSLPLLEIEDKLPVLGGTVYFAPADYHALIESNHRFALNADEPVNFSRPSVDALFESAAHVYGPAALGVVLTGANSDGAAGLRAIRDAGGFTVVQDPPSASVADMPRAALAAVGRPDLVADLDGIAALLRSLSRTGLKP
jgi:two-component system chemotaxis response regulator CheB